MKIHITRWVGMALTLLAVSACSTGEAAEDAPRLQTEEVIRGDLTILAEATGTVEPVRSVEVKSKASGEILRLYVDVGDIVQPGALLAEVDPRDVRNRYEQAQADLEVAKARTEISKAQLDRSAELLSAGVIAEQEHETKRLDYANALANQVKAETNFELSELQLQDVTIRAPMKGTIIQKNVEEGGVIQSASGNVSGGTTLFVMANLDEMQVRTLVDETDMGQIQAGLTTTVEVEAFPDRTFRGNVQKIEPQATVQQNVTMFPVIVTLDNRAGLLKPGMNAEVNILIAQALDVLLVPNSAIVRPQDVGPAALALGLDVESMDLTQFMRAGRNGNGGARPGEADSEGAAATPAAPGAAGANPMRSQFDSLRAKVGRGEITQDSMRVLMAGMRGAAGGAMAAPADVGVPARRTRASVVFVMGTDSVPVPRLIQVGLNDWDNSQVASGLEEGEVLVVVSAAQLQAQQTQWLSQMRSRMGGSPFGGGGMGGGRPPGR
ncbi:MAG TPA: efflux RND transporter periplasmic adaptor subunit [Longimicrobiales bacterium]|nr:efflux RND transporter periplasmic adaptor subunit [Longimicrobiales bacterium]